MALLVIWVCIQWVLAISWLAVNGFDIWIELGLGLNMIRPAFLSLPPRPPNGD